MTRGKKYQLQTSLLVAATALAQSCVDRKLDPDGTMFHPRTPSGLGDAWDFVTAPRAISRPYLSQGHPHMPLVAEIAGMSDRTLQRGLAQSGSTYSQIVQEARFSTASELLADPHLNITDIAFAAGCDNTRIFTGRTSGEQA